MAVGTMCLYNILCYCMYIVYYMMYIGKAAGPVSYIFRALTYPPPLPHHNPRYQHYCLFVCPPDPYPASRARAEFNIIH